MAKQNIDVKVATLSLNGSPAANDATSDAIEFKESVPWTLNVWIDSTTGSGATATVQVSNDEDVDSFVDLDGATGLSLPCAIESSAMNFRYMRIIYLAGSVTGGTKEFRLYKEI